MHPITGIFYPREKLSIPYTSYRCVSHPPNDKLKLTNPWEHHIALSLLWPHGSPIPLNTYTSWWRGVTAFTLKQWILTDHPSLPTIPVFPCAVWTTLGYYPKPISLTNLPYLPEYVDPRCPSRQWLRLVSWWVTRWVFSWQCCSTRDKAPHTTTPILRVTTTEPQTPGTGHKKMKIRHLPMDKLNPPPPDIGTLTCWHTRRESPQQPISPETWWKTPVTPCALRYQYVENRKIRYWCYTKK